MLCMFSLYFCCFLRSSLERGGGGEDILSPFVCFWAGPCKERLVNHDGFPIFGIYMKLASRCDVRVVISSPRYMMPKRLG